MPTSHADRLSADWFDSEIYSGCLALSLVMTDDVPLEGVFPIRIVEEFFDNRGTGVATRDDSWMVCPYTIMTKWLHLPRPIRSVLEDYSIATQALRRATDGEIGGEGTAPPDSGVGQQRSVVIVVLPVKAREPALFPQDGTVGALMFVHWVLAEWMRAVRMATNAAIGDLTQGRLPLMIPVRYAEVADGGTLRWTAAWYDVCSDELVKRVLPQPIVSGTAAESIGEAFGQITWGRPGAVVFDHIKRGDSAKFYGDDVGALLAYATACELAIVNLTLALAWEDGVRAEDAARTYRDMSVTTMLTSLCHPLGGTWSVDKPGFSRDWRVHVAEVRNRIIHAGFRPTPIDVARARHALEALMTTIPKRLVGKWRRYPNTLALLVSRGSVDLYASKKAHSKIVESLEARSHASEVEFAAWRNDYLSAS